MLIVVAIVAEQFPVAAVRGVVIVVVVFVVNGKLAKSFAFEFSAAAATDWREHLERLFAISPHPLFLFAANLRDEMTIPVA